MNVFKLRTGTIESIKITEKNFSEKTNKKRPYFFPSENGNAGKYFAVCPLCDNPIQIIGLYKAHEEGKNPYGRHYPKDIVGLANYDEEAYYGCVYSNPNRRKKVVKRKPNSVTGMALYDFLYKEFEQIIYALENSLEIKISYNFAEEMLTQYIANEGWLYYETTYYNLPWMLIYAMQAKSLINRLILKDGELYQFLNDKCDKVSIKTIENSKYAKVEAKDGFVDLTFYLCNHEITHYNENIQETYDFKVVEDDMVVYERKIKVEASFLKELIKVSEKRKRNSKMQDIARKIMK